MGHDTFVIGLIFNWKPDLSKTLKGYDSNRRNPHEKCILAILNKLQIHWELL